MQLKDNITLLRYHSVIIQFKNVKKIFNLTFIAFELECFRLWGAAVGFFWTLILFLVHNKTIEILRES